MGAHRDPNKRRAQIIMKCYECYIEKGIENTSVRDLCRATNENPNTLYYYFKNKEGILFECVNFGYKKLEDAMFNAVAHGTPEEMTKTIIDVCISFFPEMSFLCQAVASPSYEKFRSYQLAKVDNFYKRFGEQFSHRLECPYAIVRPFINDFFVFMSYWSLWGNDNMATIQCHRIFQELTVVVDKYKKESVVYAP